MENKENKENVDCLSPEKQTSEFLENNKIFLPQKLTKKYIKERQKKYYTVLEKCDNVGESTFFIEFMLEIILDSLESLLKTQNVALTNSDRIEIFKTLIKDEYFTRKDYLRNFKKISQATASRDLQFAVENKILKKFGDKNTTKYKFLKKANKA